MTLGTIARDRAELVKARHQIIQDEVQAGIEETRHCKMVGLNEQGAWTK